MLVVEDDYDRDWGWRISFYPREKKKIKKNNKKKLWAGEIKFP